jgi:hypothetical protein
VRDLHNKCVRLILQPGEDPPADLDCLQLQIQRVKEEQDISVAVEEFDLKVLFEQAAAEVGLEDEFRDKAWEKMQ